jgi:hypothetical protein
MAVLTSLRRFTNYSVQVLAFTRVGDGVTSKPITCTTEEDGTDWIIVMLTTAQQCTLEVKCYHTNTGDLLLHWLTGFSLGLYDPFIVVRNNVFQYILYLYLYLYLYFIHNP